MIPFFQMMGKLLINFLIDFYLEEFVKCFPNKIYKLQQFIITNVCNIGLLCPGLLTAQYSSLLTM